MCGLEPPGSLPTPETFASYQQYKFNFLADVTKAFFTQSFFVTSEMKGRFKGSLANGIAPVICLLLARSGMSIDKLRFGGIDESGRFVEVDRDAALTATGVELSFHSGSIPMGTRLYYFKTDLGLPFAANAALQRFLDLRGAPDTLIKSASFLLHADDFRALRGFILARSNLILQDDSGIPYRYFKQAGWKVELFGQYSRPENKYFKDKYQPDLAADFDDSKKVKPLGFPIGYGSRRRSSSLMLAIRPANAESRAAPMVWCCLGREA